MSKYPAQFLSAFDIGHRVRVTSLTGAVVEDVLTSIKAISAEGGETRLFLTFQSVRHYDVYNQTLLEVALDSKVKRIIK